MKIIRSVHSPQFLKQAMDKTNYKHKGQVVNKKVAKIVVWPIPNSLKILLDHRQQL